MADVRVFNAFYSPSNDVEITLEVDFDILTSERAAEINAFWSEADERLACCDGDARDAVIRLAARFFIVNIMEPKVLSDEINQVLYDAEGWGGYHYNGIRMTGFIGGPPEYDFDDFEVAEVANG
jgi:hypothetical protein